MLPDRFSDGKESERALYKPERAEEFALPETEKKAWDTSAMQWQGGNLRGIMSKLPYLKVRTPHAPHTPHTANLRVHIRVAAGVGHHHDLAWAGLQAEERRAHVPRVSSALHMCS